jgi:DNA end-binding protein Ku
MPRPIWNGSISFGLVNIPVKLYNAVKKKSLHFNQLRKGDGCRIRLKKICSTDGKEVPSDHIVKGYEISPERYVIITAGELEALHPKLNRGISIEDFVTLEQIDPIYYEQTYYLVPDKGAEKAYSLLLEAMRQSQKIAIARLVLRNKQYLAAIRPGAQALTLSTMHFADEIVDMKNLEILPGDNPKPDKRELLIALQLIESLSTEFTPAKYRDEYREKVMAMIEKKAKGQDIVAQPSSAEQPGTKVVDLMAALEASLATLNKKQSAQTPVKARRRKARAQ